MTIKLFFANFSFKVVRFSGWPPSLHATVLLTALASGCAVQDVPKTPVVIVPELIVPKPVALTPEADTALKAAEQVVIEARIKRALWTAAVEQLSSARIAAKQFDSVATLRHAREVIVLCELSVAQLSKSPVKW